MVWLVVCLLTGCARNTVEGACGGAVIHLDWVCRADGWRLERVGEQEWSCETPHARPLAGRIAACQVAALHACAGDGDPVCDTTVGCDAAPPDEPCDPIHD